VSKSAFSTAVDFFRMAVTLLPPNSWQNYYDLCALIYQQLAQSEFMCSHFEESESAGRLLLAHAKTTEHKYPAYRFIVKALDGQGKTDAAIKFGFDTLRSVFGMKFGSYGRINLDFYKCRMLLNRKTNEEILAEPGMTDPKLLATMKMLITVASIKAKRRIHLITWKCSDRMVLLSLRHGISPESGPAFASLGLSEAYCWNIKNAYRMGQLSAIALERFRHDKNGRVNAMVLSQVACFHYVQPIYCSIAVFETAFCEGSAAGEAKSMIEAAGWYMNMSIITGVFLPTLETHMRSIGTGLARLYKDRSFEMMVLPQWQYALNMIDCIGGDPIDLTGEVMNEGIFLKYSKEYESFGIMPIYYALKVQLSVHFGRFQDTTNECIKHLSLKKHQRDETSLYWHICVYQIRLYVGISMIQMSKGIPGRYMTKARKLIRQSWHQMKKDNPNATLVYHILQAVYLSGKHTKRRKKKNEVYQLFTKAIELAENHQFYTALGLACEYAAYYANSVGDAQKASIYSLAALEVYQNQMGAYTLVEHLETKFEFLGISLARPKENGQVTAP